MSHHISVLGKAAPQGSKKHVGNGRHVESSKTLPGWRKAIINAAKNSHGPDWEPLDGPLVVTFTAWMQRPPTTKFKDLPAGAPDLDKLQRAVGDALTIAGTIKDDARITTWIAKKRWAIGCEPGATITIRPEQEDL